MRAAGTRTTGPATPPPSTEAALRQEVESLRTENRELRESLDAIRRGEVDALIVTEDGTPRVYSLEGVDHPYRALVERIQEGALTLTTEGIILFANAAFARMRDLPLSGVLGTPFSSHVAAPDREQFARVLADAQASSRRCELGICAGAGTVPAALSLTPIEAGGATTIGVVVTDRRRDYDRLRLQGRMLDAVVDAVTAADPDGTLIYWNGAAERLYGWTAAEMVGRPMASSTEPEVTGEEARRVLTILNAGQAWSGEHMARHRDGRCFPVQATKAPVFDEDGRLVAVIGTSQDISERKQAENALRESEGRLLLAQSAGGIGVYDWDLATGQVVWSPQLETVFGMATPADPRERHDAWFRCVHPEDRDRLQQEMRRWLESGRDRTAWKYRFVRADGEERWIEGQSLLVRDGEGRPARVIGTNTDITDWKRTEASLRSYAEHLRRSNEDLERFAYVASHDLQEPLRSIVSFSQLLDRRYKGKLGQDADEYIAFIVEGGTRMQRLILDLLAYSRVNTNPQELRPTDVEAVIAAVERQLTPSLSEAGAALTSDPLPVVTADPLQLEQVFANLVSNAVKFRRDDGPLRIHVGARRVDGFWEFSISDNGIGIEEEYFDRIFVIFKRLHTKDAYPGTGIGLAIVKRIIDRHGGTVRVESTPGEGSTFFFTLPAA